MKSDGGAPAVFSIGVVDGGSTDGGACADACRALGRRVQSARQSVTTPVNVNVVFQLAGRFLTPDFRGVRTGRFSANQSWLLVQAAVFPDEVVDAPTAMLQLLGEAVAEAESWASSRRTAESLDGLTRQVEGLKVR